MARAIIDLAEWIDGPIEGDAIAMHRQRASDYAEPQQWFPDGQLWQRVEESGRNLFVTGEWIAWGEMQCGRCNPPYPCAPGNHEEPVRHLPWLAERHAEIAYNRPGISPALPKEG